MINAFFGACFAFVFIQCLNFNIKFKPFSCEVCLAGWSTAAFAVLAGIYNLPQVIGYMCSGMLFSVFINKLLK
mgnify:CR=1 FL=1